MLLPKGAAHPVHRCNDARFGLRNGVQVVWAWPCCWATREDVAAVIVKDQLLLFRTADGVVLSVHSTRLMT